MKMFVSNRADQKNKNPTFANMKRTFVAIGLFFLLSCNDRSGLNPLDFGYDYYPVQIGQYRVYRVSEINYIGSVADSKDYYLREEITGSIVSENGTTKYFLKKSRSDDSLNWSADSMWTVRWTDNSLVVAENNLPLVKLVFPVQTGKKWDGNVYNINREKAFYYEEVAEVAGAACPDTSALVKVVMADVEKNIVNQDERSEVYGRGIGLVSKDYRVLNFCRADCASLGEIESGRILNQKLVSYGRL